MQGLLRDALEIVKAPGSNGRSRYTIKALDEKLSFDKGFYVFIRAVQLLVNKNKGVILVSPMHPPIVLNQDLCRAP
jgi:uridine kinase